MKRIFLHTPIIGVLLVLVFLAAGCESTPEEIPEGLSKAEMFQLAQEASDQERWEAAIAYYQEFIDRFPDDKGAIAEARYEIAFLTYKLGNLEESLALFRDLLNTYEMENSNELPAWPRVLSERVIEKIQEEMQPALDVEGGEEAEE